MGPTGTHTLKKCVNKGYTRLATEQTKERDRPPDSLQFRSPRHDTDPSAAIREEGKVPGANREATALGKLSADRARERVPSSGRRSGSQPRAGSSGPHGHKKAQATSRAHRAPGGNEAGLISTRTGDGDR